eukprot:gene935-biopygen789
MYSDGEEFVGQSGHRPRRQDGPPRSAQGSGVASGLSRPGNWPAVQGSSGFWGVGCPKPPPGTSPPGPLALSRGDGFESASVFASELRLTVRQGRESPEAQALVASAFRRVAVPQSAWTENSDHRVLLGEQFDDVLVTVLQPYLEAPKEHEASVNLINPRRNPVEEGTRGFELAQGEQPLLQLSSAFSQWSAQSASHRATKRLAWLAWKSEAERWSWRLRESHGMATTVGSCPREEYLVGWSPGAPDDSVGREMSPRVASTPKGAYRLELHQKSICEAKELLQQMREDPYNSLERFKFSAFAVNINKPGEIVGRGVSIQDVRKTVLTAVKVSGSTRKSYRGSRKSRKEPSGSTVSGGNWANRFALLSSSEEEDPRVAPKPRSREPGPSSRTRREPQRNRKPGRAPASSPGHPSSGEASLSSSEVAQERRELQELKAALQKESQAREAAAEALMEKLSQQLQESQQVAEERRASEQRATEERRASEQRAAEERWAAEQLAAETREAARRLAIDKGVAQQLAADERRAEDRRLAQVQLEETLQAVIESQIQKLALVQTSPLGPTESDARGPAAELSGPASETPTSRPGQELVEPASVVTCDVENRGIPSSPEDREAGRFVRTVRPEPGETEELSPPERVPRSSRPWLTRSRARQALGPKRRAWLSSADKTLRTSHWRDRYALEDRTPVPSAGERQADFHAFVQEELDRERKELQQEDELSHWDEQVRKRITAKQAAAAVQVAVYPPDYPEQGAVQKAVAIGLLADACTYFLPDSDSDTGGETSPVKVLVDSGASTNIIAESTVQQLKGIKPVRHEQAMRVRVADGTTYDANSCVRPKLQAETSKGSYSQQVELRVMPIDLKVDIILGGPWLADLSPVTLDYKNWGSVRFAKGREEVVITGCSPGSPDPGRPKDTAMALVQGVILSQRRARRDLRALRAKEEQAFVVYLAPDGLFGASACDKGGEDSDEDSPNNVVAGLASEPSSGSEDVNEKPPAPSAAAREGASESEGPGVLVLDYSSDSSDANGVCHLGRVGAVVEELRPKGFTSTADEAGDHPDPLSVFANKREANGAFALLPAAVRRQAIEDHAAGVLVDDMIWRVAEGRYQLVLAQDSPLRELVMREAHESPAAGHTGREKTLDRVNRRFWWPRMSRDVTDWCKSCVVCQQTRPRNSYPDGQLNPLQVPVRLWQVVSIDFVTGLPRTERGYDAFATFTDKLSKMVHVVPMLYADSSAAQVARMYFDQVWRLHVKKDTAHETARQFVRQLQLAREKLLLAQQQQIAQYDARHKARSYAVGDEVWVDATHLTQPGDQGLHKKLLNERLGPLRVLEVFHSDRQMALPVSDRGAPSAYRLQTPKQWKVHDVFTVDRLSPVELSSRFVERATEIPPPPTDVSGRKETHVERVERSRTRQRKGRRWVEYLVKWTGMPRSENKWKTREDLEWDGAGRPGVPDRALLEFERIEAKRVEREKLRVRKARDESVGAVWTTLSEELRVDGAMPWVPEERFDDEVGTFARVSVDVAVPLVNGAAALEKEPIGQTKILVLFSGTGSVEKQFTKQFPDSKVVAVDIQPQMAPYSF